MAAAEYFSNAPMQQQPQSPYQGPTSHPQPQTSSPYLQQPTPQHPAPPPYSNSVHFAPTPQEIPQRHSFSHQQRPPQNSWNQSPQPHSSHLVPHNQRPYHSNGSSPGSYGSPQQKPQYLSPHMRPYAQPNSSQYSLTSGGYASDPEPQRRRHQHHRSRKDEGSKRSVDKSRSKNTDAFLGAAGGGLIGDLIFPGLGTVGGAALGWFGGKDYANHRKGREDRRAQEQRDWEKKYGSGRHRDRSRSS